MRKHRDIELATPERRRNYLVSELRYIRYSKFFKKCLLAIEMKKKHIILNKPVYLGLSLLELSKMLMYGIWYDIVKEKYSEKAKMCFMNTDSFTVYIKTDDIYKDIAEDVENRIDTSNYELDQPLSKGKNKK